MRTLVLGVTISHTSITRTIAYYRGHYSTEQHLANRAENQTVHLAQCNDGINFKRARIGLVEHCGTKDNNVVFKGYEGHNFCVFHDTNPVPQTINGSKPWEAQPRPSSTVSMHLTGDDGIAYRTNPFRSPDIRFGECSYVGSAHKVLSPL